MRYRIGFRPPALAVYAQVSEVGANRTRWLPPPSLPDTVVSDIVSITVVAAIIRIEATTVYSTVSQIQASRAP